MAEDTNTAMSVTPGRFVASRGLVGGKGATLLVGRALCWWVLELRGIYDDIVNGLRNASAYAVTVEAGERDWIVRRRGRQIGQIDWYSCDARTRQNELHALVSAGRHVGRVLVEVPPDRVLSKVVSFPATA